MVVVESMVREVCKKNSGGVGRITAGMSLNEAKKLGYTSLTIDEAWQLLKNRREDADNN